MSLEPYWPKKKGRPPSEETLARRILKAHQEKLRQAEKDEPLSDFAMMAKLDALRRKR